MMTSRTQSEDPNQQVGLADGGFLVGGWLLAAMGAAYLIVPSGILPVVQRELLVGAVGGSWLLSAPYAAEALGGIPTGVALDRFDARKVVTLAVVVLLGANAWGAIAGGAASYPSLLASRFVGGVAYSMLWLGTIHLVTDRFADRTATAVGIHTTSGPAGLAAGLALGPAITAAFKWYTVFWVLAIGLLLAFCTFAFTTHSQPQRSPGSPEPLQQTLSLVFRNESLLLVAVLSFVAYSLFLLFSGWMPTYLAEEFGLSLEQSGLYVAVFPAVGIVARSAGGIVSDYVLGDRPRLVIRVSFLVLLPVVCGIALVSSVIDITLLLILGGFFVQSGIGLFFTYGSKLVAETAEGTAVAFLSTIGLTGAFTAPIIAGVLVSSPGGYTAVFGYAILLCLLGLGATIRIPALS